MSVTMLPVNDSVTPRASTQPRSGRSFSPDETISGPAPSLTYRRPLRDGIGLAREGGAGAGPSAEGSALDWRARIYDADSGAFLGALTTRGARDLRDAEAHVTAVAGLLFRMDPQSVVVRHLSQVSKGVER